MSRPPLYSVYLTTQGQSVIEAVSKILLTHDPPDYMVGLAKRMHRLAESPSVHNGRPRTVHPNPLVAPPPVPEPPSADPWMRTNAPQIIRPKFPFPPQGPRPPMLSAKQTTLAIVVLVVGAGDGSAPGPVVMQSRSKPGGTPPTSAPHAKRQAIVAPTQLGIASVLSAASVNTTYRERRNCR